MAERWGAGSPLGEQGSNLRYEMKSPACCHYTITHRSQCGTGFSPCSTSHSSYARPLPIRPSSCSGRQS